jgi:branched-subunit amino acid transport protein
MTRDEILLIFGMFLVTFGVRYPVLALVGKLPLPEAAFRALRYVPAAVLAAIIAPAIILDTRGQLAINLGNEYLIAGIVTFFVAWRAKNMLLTIVIGMVTLIALKTLGV